MPPADDRWCASTPWRIRSSVVRRRWGEPGGVEGGGGWRAPAASPRQAAAALPAERIEAHGHPTTKRAARRRRRASAPPRRGTARAGSRRRGPSQLVARRGAPRRFSQNALFHLSKHQRRRCTRSSRRPSARRTLRVARWPHFLNAVAACASLERAGGKRRHAACHIDRALAALPQRRDFDASTHG